MTGRSDYLFTSESVSEGHPDKVCDRISDAILDAFLADEPEARVACETFATTDRVVVGGEVRGPGSILANVEEIVRAKPAAAKGRYIRSITLASTMGPGIKVDPARTRDILEEAAPAAA